jgi:hypothetical protein
MVVLFRTTLPLKYVTEISDPVTLSFSTKLFYSTPMIVEVDNTWSYDATQPLTEMSTRSRKIIFLGSKVRRLRKADNLTAICEPIV